jgi:chemotaxis protein methyltransferase CheR
VLSHLHQQMRPEGALSLGSAETVIGISTLFTPDAEMRGIYRRTGLSVATPAPRPSGLAGGHASVAAQPLRRPALSLVPGRAG